MNFYDIEAKRKRDSPDDKVDQEEDLASPSSLRLSGPSSSSTPNAIPKSKRPTSMKKSRSPFFRRRTKQSMNEVSEPVLPLVAPISSRVSKEIEENMLVSVTGRSGFPEVYSFRVTDIKLTDLCQPPDDSLSLPSPHLYSNSLNGIILLVEPPLSYSSKTNRGHFHFNFLTIDFLKMCRSSTEFHFADVDKQLADIRSQAGSGFRPGTRSSFSISSFVMFISLVIPASGNSTSSAGCPFTST